MRAIGPILVLGVIAAASSCTAILGKFEEVGTGGGGGSSGSSSSASNGSSSSGATTSSSSSSTTSASSSSGGCTVPANCPAPAACMDATCTLGMCGTTPTAAGMPSSKQTKGDCQTIVCDGNGGTSTQNDDTDGPDDNNPCTADTCDQGAPVHTPINGSCGNGMVCGDPAGPNAGMCVPATCGNGTKDGTETDVDCGGALCPKCDWAKSCTSGSDCVSGFCQTATMPVNTCGADLLVTGLVNPLGVALDATTVYFTDAGNVAGQGIVGSVPKAGGTMKQLAGSQVFPMAIAYQAGEVYWVERGGSGGTGGRVNKVASSGGSISQLAGNQQTPVSIALDASYAYFTGGNRVSRVLLAGGTVQALATAQNGPLDVVVNATDAYFTNTGSVNRFDLQAMSVSTFANGQNNTSAIALDANAVYWIDNGADRVMRAPLAGGMPVSMANISAASIPAGTGIAVSDTDVYFAVQPNGATMMSVMKVPLGAAGATPTFVGQSTSIRTIVVDAQYVYWASLNTVRRVLR